MGVRGQRTLCSCLVNASGAEWIQCRCGVSVVRVEGLYPSPPTPLPFEGRGELDAGSGRKADAFPPLPFEGRGAGGEGSKNRGIALLTLPGQCRSSVVVEYPWCVWEGRFTPHPRPLPLKGRGELAADCGRKADAFTPLPFEGRGDGGEGSKNPGSASSTPPGQCGSSVVVEYPWCVWEGRFTPHPHPSPLKGRGELDADCGRKADAFPLSPLRGEGLGVRGQRTLPAPRQRLRGSADPASLWTIRGACGRGVSPLTPDPSPLKGRGELDAGSGRKADSFPLSPLRGEGMGVRGQRTLPAPRQRLRGSVDPASLWTIRGAAGEGRFTPHPRPLSPGRGEGSWMRIAGEKQTLPPLPSEGRGDGGEGSKNPGSASSTPPGQCGSSVVVDYPWCVW
jgi:hypothetical protein